MVYISIENAIKQLELMADNNKLGKKAHIILNLKTIDDINEILEHDTEFSLTKRSVDEVMQNMPHFKKIRVAEKAFEKIILKAANKFWKGRKRNGSTGRS